MIWCVEDDASTCDIEFYAFICIGMRTRALMFGWSSMGILRIVWRCMWRENRRKGMRKAPRLRGFQYVNNYMRLLFPKLH